MRRNFWPLALASLAPCASAQTTWYVDRLAAGPGDGSQANPFTSIQYAIDQAAVVSGDTLSVAPGTYEESLNFIGKSLALVSQQGAATTRLRAPTDGRAILLESLEGPFTRIEGFTLSGGAMPHGGVAKIEGAHLTLVDSIVAGGNANQGGGIWGHRANLTLVGIDFQACGADTGGGLYLSECDLTINGGEFRNNRASGHSGPAVRPPWGGAIFLNDCDAAIEGVRFEANAVPLFSAEGGDPQGGALFAQASTLTVNDCAFLMNRASDLLLFLRGSGGAIFVGPQSLVTIDSCHFERNLAGASSGVGYRSEGGAYVGPGSLRDCTFIQNFADHGGAVGPGPDISFSPYELVIENSVISDNSAGSGGGVVGPARLIGCSVERNFAAIGGGANACDLVDCLVRANQAHLGGGIANRSAVECRLVENRALAGSIEVQMGGGAGGSYLEKCLITGNIAEVGGGAAASTLDHCLVLGNEAQYGGGVSKSILEHCTLTGNVASETGGAVGSQGADYSTIHHSIVWGNQPSRLPVGVAPNTSYSLIEGGAGAGPGILDEDPRFWLPVTADLHLLPVSPCIDAGDPNSPPDSDGSIADLGAYEFDAAWIAGPGRYCDAVEHTGGCVATMSTSGSATLSGADDFVLRASDVLPSTTGLFFWSREPWDVPFGEARLCIRGPFVRTPAVTIGGTADPCSGSAEVAFTQADMAAAGLAPYDTIYTQLFFRDPSSTPFGAALSDALEITVLP